MKKENHRSILAILAAISVLFVLLSGKPGNAQGIRQTGSVDVGSSLRALSPTENPNQWWAFSFPNQLLRISLLGLREGTIEYEIPESLQVDNPLTTVSGLAYHPLTDTFFISTTEGDLRRHQRMGNLLVTLSVTQFPGSLVTPPEMGNLKIHGVTVNNQDEIVITSDNHVLTLDENLTVLSQFTLDTMPGLAPPLGIDFNPGNGRLGLISATTSDIHTYQGETPVATATLDGLVLSPQADFCWDPEHGTLIVTEANSDDSPDLFLLSLTADPQIFTVTTSRDTGNGSLRRALELANENIIADVITFGDNLFPPFIRLTSNLPPLTEGWITIDGDSNQDGTPDIHINANLSQIPLRGLSIASHRNTVRGLGFSGIRSTGIFIRQAEWNVIESCYIGVNSSGEATQLQGGHGIHLIKEAANNRISNSVITGWNNDGIRIENKCHHTIIEGCRIGTNQDGLFSVGNGGSGINVLFSNGHRIGGSDPGQGNVIALSGRAGILIESRNAMGPSSDIDIQANIIGADPSGTLPLGNGLDGIRIFECSNIRIGGSTPDSGNRILFHQEFGILIQGANTAGISTRHNITFANQKPGIGRFFGAQNFINPPIFDDPSEFVLDGLFVRISGVGQQGSTIDFYRVGNSQQPNRQGETAQFLASGRASNLGLFDVELPGALSLGDAITAIQTDPQGNSSDYSGNSMIPDLPRFSVRRGTVNSGAGPLSDVLTINGSPGDGSRTLYLNVGEPITAFLDGPPSRAGMGSPFALYVWRGPNLVEDLTPLPFQAGNLIMPPPFSPSPRQPKVILNNIGFTTSLGEPTASSTPAPTQLMSVPSGVSRPGTFVVQGLIRDDATETGLRVAVTNAVVVEISE